jgi:hypothetical protein
MSPSSSTGRSETANMPTKIDTTMIGAVIRPEYAYATR